MELESEDGAKIGLRNFCKTEIGRGLGFPSDDRTVSRRHIVMEPKKSDQDEDLRVYFEVLGKTPIWVFTSGSEDKRLFRNFEKGELCADDRISLSLRKPFFFTLKKLRFYGEDEEQKRVLNAVERRKMRTLEREGKKGDESLCCIDAGREKDREDFEFGPFDTSQIDPIKEFGFLVMGQEFNQYPNQRIRDIRNWDWFLEEQRGNNEDGDVSPKWRKGKNKKGEHNDDDEDWMGESDDDKTLMARINYKKPRYSNTRSKDREKHPNDTPYAKKSISKDIAGAKKSSVPRNTGGDIDDNEDTLGGFIVMNDEPEVEEEEEFDDEEEEEFEDEDEDEDEDEEPGEEEEDTE